MLLNYHIGRLVLSSLCVGDLVRLVLSGVRFAGRSSACKTNTTQNQPHIFEKYLNIKFHENPSSGSRVVP